MTMILIKEEGLRPLVAGVHEKSKEIECLNQENGLLFVHDMGDNN